jgi:hypothetical protein
MLEILGTVINEVIEGEGDRVVLNGGQRTYSSTCTHTR